MSAKGSAMRDDHGGLARHDRLGCAAGCLLGGSLFVILAVLDALGDCNGVTCGGNVFTNAILPSGFVALLANTFVRWILAPKTPD